MQGYAEKCRVCTGDGRAAAASLIHKVLPFGIETGRAAYACMQTVFCRAVTPSIADVSAQTGSAGL
jgi:hypothetical protein